MGKFSTQDFTVSLWFKTSDSSLDLFDILGDRTSFANGQFFCLRMNKNGKLTLELSQGTSGDFYVFVGTPTGFNDDQWHQVTIVKEGTTVKIYVDGVLAGQNNSNYVINPNNSNPFKLGRSLVHQEFLRYSGDAIYDELRIFYNVALSGQQIACLYNKAIKS